MGANFTPEYTTLGSKGAFRFWCQTVLPLVYDDSLSYYELLCKVVAKLNEQIEYSDQTNENVRNLYNAYIALQDYVNHYFDNLDISDEVDRKLDELVASGALLVNSFKGRTGAVVPAVGDYTADMVGAVNKAGDTMTGMLAIRPTSTGVVLELDPNNSAITGVFERFKNNGNIFGMIGFDAVNNFIFQTADGTKRYTVLHTGNKPSGSYTGNGSAAARTIDTGGIGGCVRITSANGVCFLTPAGGIGADGTTVVALADSFSAGVINTVSTNKLVNENGMGYFYQVL